MSGSATSDQRSILDLAAHLHPSTDDRATGDHTYLRYWLLAPFAAALPGRDA